MFKCLRKWLREKYIHWKCRRADFRDNAKGFGITPFQYRKNIIKRWFRDVIKKHSSEKY